MQVDGLGEVVTDGAWWLSDPIALPYLEGALVAFRVETSALKAAPSDLCDAIKAFLRLSKDDRLLASEYVHAHYLDTVDAIRSRPHLYAPLTQPILDLPIHAPRDVWSHVTPGDAAVERREDDGLIYVSLRLDIPWDQEHGLQVIYRRGRELSRVSSIDGHLTTADAYALAEQEDRIYFSRADALSRVAARRSSP